MSYRAVAFDMDGLILNTEVLYDQAGWELMRQYGKTYPAELRQKIMGRPPHECFVEMIRWNGLDVTPERLAVESHNIYLRMVREQGVELMPGLHTLLDWLESHNIRKCICTSSVGPLVSETFDPHGLRPRFEFVLTSEEITRGKPHPDIYLLAATRLGISPTEMVVLEDSRNGCYAAKAARATAVAVAAAHCQGIEYEMADLKVKSLDDPRLFEFLAHSDNLSTPK